MEFLRYLLDIPLIPDYRQVVERQFAGFIQEHGFNADQVRFLRVVKDVFIQKRRLQPVDFYIPPLSVFGMYAVDSLFSPSEIHEVLMLATKLEI